MPVTVLGKSISTVLSTNQKKKHYILPIHSSSHSSFKKVSTWIIVSLKKVSTKKRARSLMIILFLYCLSMSTQLFNYYSFSFYKKFGSKQIANSMLYCHEKTLISSVFYKCYCTVLFVNCNCSMFVQKTTTTVKTSQVLSMSCQMYCLKNHLKIFKKNYKCLFVIYSMFQCSVSVLNVQCYMFKLNVCLFNFISSLIACRKLRSQRRKKKKKIYFLHVLHEN